MSTHTHINQNCTIFQSLADTGMLQNNIFLMKKMLYHQL